MRIRVAGNAKTREVTVNGMRLDPKPSQAIWNHSPDGFNWGYGGSGPAQLALAILLTVANEKTACKHYQQFKSREIADLPIDQDFDEEFDIDEYLQP